MWERIWHMLAKEFIQVFRDPRMKGMIFAMPIVQLMVFGYAVTTDVKHVALAVLDRDYSQTSRDLTSRFTASGYFDAASNIQDEREARELIDRGEAQAVLRIDKGFEEDLGAGRKVPVQVIVDGTDSNTAGIILNYAGKIIGRYSEEVLLERLARAQGGARRDAGIVVETRAWFNENLESRNFYVPGVIAMLVTLITLMLTGMAVVREKEIGTMEQIMVTPIRSVEFILGKSAPFALIGIVDMLLITVVGVFWFDVPIRGSVLLLFGTTCLYLMTSLGIGLFISTVSGTQQQAMMTTFFFFFPAILLSGYIFPIANMPEVIQWLTYLNPMRYFLVIIRGIFLKGVGLSVLWPEMAALAVIGVVVLTFAVRRFHKTVS